MDEGQDLRQVAPPGADESQPVSPGKTRDWPRGWGGGGVGMAVCVCMYVCM